MYSITTNSPTTQFYSFLSPSQCQGHFKQNKEFKSNYFDGSDVLPPTFPSQL